MLHKPPLLSQSVAHAQLSLTPRKVSPYGQQQPRSGVPTLCAPTQLLPAGLLFPGVHLGALSKPTGKLAHTCQLLA